jgi:hypothetical protein
MDDLESKWQELTKQLVLAKLTLYEEEKKDG